MASPSNSESLRLSRLQRCSFLQNTAFVVFEHQKVASSAVAAANYLQDMALEGNLEGLAPQTNEQTGEKEDGDLVQTASSSSRMLTAPISPSTRS